MLSFDKKMCTTVTSANKINYCLEYQTDTNQNIICASCQPGYLLNLQNNTCTLSKDKSNCLITKAFSANDNGTCMRCDANKFYFSSDLKASNDIYQICVYNSYWSTSIKIWTVLAGVLILLIIAGISYKKISSKKVIEQRDQYVEA